MDTLKETTIATLRAIGIKNFKNKFESNLMTNHIAIHQNICHGKPHIAGTRIMVSQILELLAAGKTFSEIRSEDYFPDITSEDITACIEFANNLVLNEDVEYAVEY
jgi:uncharacterized protein (DUF433 family)